MKFTKHLASILFYITRVIALLYSLMAIYLTFTLTIFKITSKGPVDVKDGSFTIFYPFTKIPLFLGDYTTHYISTTMLTLGIYILFLWLLSNVFNAFRGARLFTRQNVSRLSRFTILNILGPLLALLLLVVLGQTYPNAIVIVLLHILLGIFSFFMASIFKQGLQLQEEQDLTI